MPAPPPYYIVLAAGAARRMGFDKVTTAVAGTSPLDRVVRALGSRAFAIVLPSRLAAAASAIAPGATIALNDEPERGMTHSLRLGLAHVSRDRSFGVLLADMPAMTTATIARTERSFADGADVAYPVDSKGRPGHPVLFSARTRPIVDALPEGDTLSLARRDDRLVRAVWECEDRSAFLDLDDRSAWQAFGEDTI